MATSDFFKGLLRGSTADVLGTPVDLANTLSGLLAPVESGNPYANALRGLLGGGDIQTGSGDWWAQKLGLPKGQGLGYAAGQMLAPSPSELLSLARSPIMREITTYHGTPHTFPPTEKNPLGEFDLSKVGSGEGAQAYGHGIYVAESPDVAKGYRERLSGSNLNTFLFGDKEFSIIGGTPEWLNFHSLANEKGFSTEAAALAYHKLREHKGNLDAAAGDLGWRENPGKYDEEAANLLTQTQYKPEGGSLYTVDLPDEHLPNLLNWDKPLSEQPENIREALRQLNPLTTDKYGYVWNGNDMVSNSNDAEKIWLSMTGKRAYETLAGPTGSYRPAPAALRAASRAEVSEKLRGAGIPGIRYLDGSSRGAGEGTSNFVLFDPSILSILKRD